MTEIRTTALQQLCDRTRAEFGATGASLATIHRGELTAAAAGIANAALSAPMQTHTLLQIGSTTKVYTAALVHQLADRGLLDLDAPIADVLPGVRLALDESADLITARHLLSMSSGIDNGPYRDTGRGDGAVARYVELLGELPLTFRPGTAYGYSNASTIVSGLVVERLTGLCWDDALAENLLKPAGFDDSVSLVEQLPFRKVSVGHRPGPDPAVLDQLWTDGRGMGPAGSTLATTAADLARFGRLILNGGIAADGTEVLSGRAVAAMQTPHITVPARWFADNWCAGPYHKQWGGVDVFGHGGTTGHGSSTLIWIPELDLSVAVIVNNSTLGYPFAHAVLDEIVGNWFGVAKPVRPQPDPRLRIDPTPYLGEYHGHRTSYRVSAGGRGLRLIMTRDDAGSERIETELLPVGDHRFLAEDDRVTSSHNWDLAFSGWETGRAGLFHNGAFTAARQSR